MPEGSQRHRFVPGPKRGEERRQALLEALERLLKERPLAEITVEEVAAAAGLTRSSFYFYFPSKAAAVAASLGDVFEEMMAAAAEWGPESDDPREGLRRTVAVAVERWRAHAWLFMAMFDAVGSDPEVREIWQAWIDAYTEPGAARIEQARTAGRAPSGADARVLTAVLIGMIISAMERDIRRVVRGEPPEDQLVEAIAEIWHRSVYVRD